MPRSKPHDIRAGYPLLAPQLSGAGRRKIDSKKRIGDVHDDEHDAADANAQGAPRC
jgi:hypothetical protein